MPMTELRSLHALEHSKSHDRLMTGEHKRLEVEIGGLVVGIRGLDEDLEARLDAAGVEIDKRLRYDIEHALQVLEIMRLAPEGDGAGLGECGGEVSRRVDVRHLGARVSACQRRNSPCATQQCSYATPSSPPCPP